MRTLTFMVALLAPVFTFGQDLHKDGIETKKYPNGKIESIIRYKSNKADSICLWFHENGNLQSCIRFTNGRKDGLAYFYENDGKLSDIYVNENDSALAHIQLGKSGKILRSVCNGEERFYINGVPYETQHYIDIQSKKAKKKK